MSIEYNNIIELVNILYEFVYGNNKDEYIYTILKPEKINLKTILKDNSFEYQFILNSSLENKDNFKFMTIVNNDILSNNEDYKKLVIKKYFKNHPLTLVIQKHKTKYEDTLNIIDIYYELFMNQIISEFIINDKIPFFLLNICNFNIELDKLRASKDFFNLVVDQFKLFKMNDKSKFCISIYEHYHSYDTLSNLLKMELTDNELKSLFFQIFFVYAYLNYKLSNFRHNYFCIESFLIQKIPTDITYNLILGDLSFNLVNPKFICKLFNYRFSSIDGFKNIYDTDLTNSTYDIYFFFKSILDFKDINNKNLQKIKIIISNFISYDLINSPLLDEIKFKTKYTFSIIPIHILSKNNFFVNFINMNSKSKEFNIKYSKKENLDIADEWGLEDEELPKRKSKKTKKGSLKKAKANDRKISNYMTNISSDEANQKDIDVEGDDDNHKTPSDNGYKKSKSKSKPKPKPKSKTKLKEDSISSLELEEDGIFMNKEPVVNKRNDMSSILKNVGTNQLIPVIGEVQNMMDINKYQNNQVYSSDNGEPKIMDKGIYNLINNGKLPMPLINSSMMPQQENYMDQNDPMNMMHSQLMQSSMMPPQMMQSQMMQPQMMSPQMMPSQMMPPSMMTPQMMPQQMMQPQMMQPQMMQPSQMMQPQMMQPSILDMEEGMNKLPMPTIDLNKENLLSDNNLKSLNTNINELVGGSINNFFLKKKK
jgi:hypothetical protein